MPKVFLAQSCSWGWGGALSEAAVLIKIRWGGCPADPKFCLQWGKGGHSQTGHPNGDVRGEGGLLGTSGFRLGSIQLWADRRLVASLPSTSCSRRGVGRCSLQAHEGRKIHIFCNRCDSDVFHPFGRAPLPLPPPLSSDPCGLLVEEGQKQETDNSGRGCSCDSKVFAFQKV